MGKGEINPPTSNFSFKMKIGEKTSTIPIYEKLHCKGEPNQCSGGQHDPLAHTDILLFLFKDR